MIIRALFTLSVFAAMGVKRRGRRPIRQHGEGGRRRLGLRTLGAVEQSDEAAKRPARRDSANSTDRDLSDANGPSAGVGRTAGSGPSGCRDQPREACQRLESPRCELDGPRSVRREQSSACSGWQRCVGRPICSVDQQDEDTRSRTPRRRQFTGERSVRRQYNVTRHFRSSRQNACTGQKRLVRRRDLVTAQAWDSRGRSPTTGLTSATAERPP